ncbi:MAG TPA: hypothetical protein VHI13_16165 [Candidatus Kapabacteria bacterium]|nr:hypothetical protein [Candidatus Kapabacteria bacterium]
MLRRNVLLLAAVLAGTAVWMTVVHLLLFPRQGMLGISGIGFTGVALMVLNRPWLHPKAEPLPRLALKRSIAAAFLLGSSFTLLLGAIGA